VPIRKRTMESTPNWRSS